MVCASLLPTGVARGAVPSRPRPVAHARPMLLADVARGCCALALTASLLAPASQAKADFGVYFVSPADGATVSSPVEVKMGVKGLLLSPAADGPKEGTGHHHIIVDGNGLKAGQEIVFDATHLHYGKAQTTAEVVLTPGRHKLTLQFANSAHKSFGSAYAKSITVNVKAAG